MSSPSVSFVSTYPPTRCGLANFTHSLRRAIAGNRSSESGLDVTAVTGSGERDFPSEVSATVDPLRPDRVKPVLSDVAVLQHEFGIWGPNDGEGVLEVIDRLQVPTLTVLHTVLEHPSPNQRRIIEGLAQHSLGLIALSEAAGRRLTGSYDLGRCTVADIPHGGWPDVRRDFREGTRPVILTWGLLGPGKGLEDAIRALPALRRLDPKPLFVIAGQTHPNVLRVDGERYRDSLEKLVDAVAVRDMVKFLNRYLSNGDLSSLRRRATVCLFPYESRDQVSSGALVDAIAGQVPVVATRFPHAVELLSGGAGLLVDHSDPAAISAALEAFLTDRHTMSVARNTLEKLSAELSWPAVAQRYEELFPAAMDVGVA
jgi:glycosyltransferase involved in cell wall biosynthesis